MGEHAVFAHSRLAVIDVENGLQPMKRTVEGHEFVITYNGELYNTNDIRNDLKSHGYEFTTASDTEVLLYPTYITAKNVPKCLNAYMRLLSGILCDKEFSLVVTDSA